MAISDAEYGLETKLREYQVRHDAENWRVHPVERNVTAWRLQPGGSYSETRLSSGRAPLAALPRVMIDLDALLVDTQR
jgi:Uma2 family endonuclease